MLDQKNLFSLTINVVLSFRNFVNLIPSFGQCFLQILIKKGILIMSYSDPLGSLLDGHGAGEALGNGYDFWWDQPEAETAQFGTSPEYAISMHLQPPRQDLDASLGGTSQFATTPNHAKVNPGPMNVQPAQWPQQQGGTSQFATTPNHAKVNPGPMNVQPSQWAHQPGGTSQFATTPNHAEVNPGSMNFQPSQGAQQPGGTSQFATTPNHAQVNPGSMTVQWAKQQGGTSQFATTLNHAKVNSGSMNVQPHQWAQQPGGTSQFGTPPNHAVSNPGSMDVHSPHLAQQPGTSQSSNVSNADAEKRARIRESKRNSWVKKETERKENEKRLAEVNKENGVLLEANARLEKEGGEAKVKQKSVEQELSYCKEEVSRLNNKLRGQTMQVDVLSEKLVARPEATDVAEENKQLKRKIELLTTATNNPDIIKTVELQEENEKLKRELKKLRFINDALCVTLIKDEQ